MNKEVLKDDVYAILKKVNPREDFQACDNFLEDGILDSLDMLTLIEELEVFYDIVINGEDIMPDNFKDISAIINVIEKYVKEK